MAENTEYIEKYFRVLSKPDSHGIADLVPMKLWRAQRFYIENKAHRNIVLKPRQVGFSTAELADNAHALFTNPYERQTVIAHDDETASFLLSTISRFLKHLPEDMRPFTDWKSGSHIRFPKLDSYIYIDSAKSDTIGIGHGLTRVHLSEVARYPPRKADQLFADISQTVAEGGYMSLESTPQGRGGLFYRLYDAAKKKDINYKTFFFPWWWQEEYQKPVSGTLKYTEEEKILVEHFELRPEQIQFRRDKIAELGDLFYQEYPENDVDCLFPLTLILLADGTTETIRNIVNGRYKGEVLTVDNNGLLTSRKVIGWHRSPRRGRRLYRLSYHYGKNTWVGMKGGAVITEDHKVLTKRGWIEARELLNGELIATGTPAPRERAEQLIIGTVLGDGHIGKRRKLSLSHSVHQWAQVKVKLLTGFGASTCKPNKYGHLPLYTKPYPYFEWLREQFYPNGIKRVNKELVSKITDFGIAVWFLDDGNTRIRPQNSRRPISEISMGILPREDVEWLCQLLTSRGYTCKPMPHNKKYLKIQFSVDGSERLLKAIGRYVPSDMRYKLTDDCDNYEPEWYEPETTDTFWSEVEIKEIPVPTQKGRWDRYNLLYCIDVEETHNFVTLGGTVHNCWLMSEISVFDGVAIRRYLLETNNGKDDGNLTIWKDVIGGEKYLIGVDPAGGYEKGDFSVACVLRARNNEYVCRLRGKIAPDLFAQEVIRLGKRFNDAEIGVEKIMHGHTVLRILLENNYPNIYHHQDYDEITQAPSFSPGWNTSGKTKPLMIDTLNASLRAHDIISYSENLMMEASGLMWEGQKVKKAPGGYDDEVDAFMIALQIRNAAPIIESTRASVQSYARLL